MSSPEKEGLSGEDKEQPSSYYRAAQFRNGDQSAQAYFETQGLIRSRKDLELSAYRLEHPGAGIWDVVVLGLQPPENVDQQLQTILYKGTPIFLDPEVLQALQARRSQKTRKGPWVERHCR